MCDGVNTNGTTFTASFRDSLYIVNEKASLIMQSYDYFKVLNNLSSYTFSIYRRRAQAAKKWDDIHLRRTQKRLEAHWRGEKYDDFLQALMEDKSGRPNNLELSEIDAECLEPEATPELRDTKERISSVIIHGFSLPECANSHAKRGEDGCVRLNACAASTLPETITCQDELGDPAWRSGDDHGKILTVPTSLPASVNP